MVENTNIGKRNKTSTTSLGVYIFLLQKYNRSI
jgi:hypothetical protein